MGRSHHRGRIPSARAARRAKLARRVQAQRTTSLPRLRCADRKSLLLGTALASTFLLGSLLAPPPASAFTCAGDVGTGPAPINHTGINDFIICVNTEARTNAAGYTIALTTLNANHFIDLYTTGTLTSEANVGNAFGIFAATTGSNSPVSIESLGDITATSSANRAAGFFVVTDNGNSPIDIVNSGDITANAPADDAYGIFVRASGVNSPVAIENSGNITAIAGGLEAFGILARTDAGNSPVSVINSGNITAKSGSDEAFGIYAFTHVGNSPISIENSGNIAATGLLNAYGLFADTSSGSSSPVNIVNSGDITASASDNVRGINARTDGAGSPIAIENSGDVGVTAEENAFGIYGRTFEPGSPIGIVNSGDVLTTATGAFSDATGIFARTDGDTDSPISILNNGDITAIAQIEALGISAETRGDDSPLSIVNSGDITTSASGATLEPLNGGIFADTFGLNSPLSLVNSGDIAASAEVKDVFGIFVDTRYDGGALSIVNSGDIVVTVGNNYGASAYGIRAFTGGEGSPLSIENSGHITATGLYSFGITAQTFGPDSPISIINSGKIDPLVGIDAYAGGAGSSITINNSGSVFGDLVGIHAVSKYGTTTIINSGNISAGTFLAIDVDGGAATIINSGHITGFVDLTDYSDTFINQKGGVFETKLTSYFGYGSDLFRNERGGTVLAATNPSVREYNSFVGLERFENKGLISLQDGQVGDVFRISNCYCSPIEFNGSGQSALAIDAYLGGPGSTADNFIIDGDVSGQTKVKVNNTNTGPGVFNKEGIPVVFVNGATPNGNEFFFGNPIDTGFFNYDLFFRPTGSGVFELRSFLGQGAFVLPQMITASQDMWHSTSDTWFDRTADLRVLLNGGAASTAYDPNARYAEGAPSGGGNITPAVWVRGSGNWLDREDSQSVTAYGRSYKYNLDRDLETIDFQSGIDLGKRGLLSENDILVFGALGGFVHADLDYDAITRAFDYQGGQVGGYATYLRGGLFVDTLVNVHLMEIDTGRSLGFPSSLDATTVGVRTDSGYRFGSFNGGAFIEPLATIAVNWADIDGFSLGGNKVSFDDDANVRGRLGLRVGTTMQVWTGTTMEPFVIGSLWGNLSDDNQATLVSTGTTFILKDDLQDVWGEVSAGVNFFNPSANTSVFAKLDVTFGDDIDGVGGKAGIRVSW